MPSLRPDGLFPEAQVVYRRGGLSESVHHIAAAVCTPDGELLAAWGDPGLVAFPRSSSKPLQALPLAELVPELPSHLLAIACASHAGTPRHLAAVRELLALSGLDESALQCGAHPPFDPGAQAELIRQGQAPGVLHHNCSGKHAGMLLACVQAGWDTASYTRPDHPLQRRITALHAELGGVPLAAVQVGQDGCSVPALALPLQAMATAFARLAAPAGPHAPALARLHAAMRAHPDLIAGPGRLDTDLMPLVPGLACKVGADGYFALSLRDSPRGPLGTVFKIRDGGERARPYLALALLAWLGVAVTPELRALAPVEQVNWAGHGVGEVAVVLG